MINLLPPSWQKERKREQRFRLLMIWGITLAVFLLSLSLLFSLMRIYLGQELVEKKAQLLVLEKEVTREGALLEEMKSWNTRVLDIKEFQEEQQSLAHVLLRLEEALPSELNLVSLSFTPRVSKKKKDEVIETPAKIAVTGRAPTRDLLFSFRENLQRDILFFDLNFPPQNWVSPVNVDFSFQANVREL